MTEILLSVKEISRSLNVSEISVRRWVKLGRLKSVRVGALLRFKQIEIARFLDAEKERTDRQNGGGTAA